MLSYGPVTTGDRLAAERNSQGLTQPEMAERFETDQGTYSKWELNKSRPSKKFHPAIAEFLGITVTELRALNKASSTSAGATDLAHFDAALRDIIANQDAHMRALLRMNEGIEQMRQAVDSLSQVIGDLAEFLSRQEG